MTLTGRRAEPTLSRPRDRTGSVPHSRIKTAVARIIVAQGSLQLITALVAAEASSPEAPPPQPDDILVLHGLTREPERSEQWAGALSAIASRLGPWKRIVFLSHAQIKSLRRLARHEGWKAALEPLRRTLGVDLASEIHLQANPDIVNALIVASYPDARSFCYGDGLGLNYSEHYWEPRSRSGDARHRVEEALKTLRRVALRTLGRDPVPPAPSFDCYCLMLPNHFDHFAADPIQLDVECFRRRISEVVSLVPELSNDSEPALGWLSWIPSQAEEVVFLLSSCFSEAGRISQDNEIAGYLEALEALAPSSAAAIVLKGHPRDERTKIERLVERLRDRYPHVHVMEGPLERFLPFEVLLEPGLRSSKMPFSRFLTFSSSCLALELLYERETALGFGAETVRRLFRPEYVERRLVQERDLTRAIEWIRADQGRLASPLA